MTQPAALLSMVSASWSRRAALRGLGRAAAASVGALTLTACGFQLRQAPDLVFSTIYLGVPPTTPLGVELRRQLQALGQVQVIEAAERQKDAQVILDVLQEQRQKVVVGMSATGQVREFQLRLLLRFRLRTPQGKELLEATDLMQQRDMSFNEAFVLAKEAEEAQLYRNMQSDIVQQLLRRLAAVKEL